MNTPVVPYIEPNFNDPYWKIFLKILSDNDIKFKSIDNEHIIVIGLKA